MDLGRGFLYKVLSPKADTGTCHKGGPRHSEVGDGGGGAVLSGLDELRQGSVKDAAFERQPWGVNRVTNTSAFSHFERSLSPPIRREGGGRRFWSVAPSACSPAHPRCPVPPQFLKHLAGKQFPPRMVLPGHSQARKGDRAGLPPSTSLLPCSS